MHVVLKDIFTDYDVLITVSVCYIVGSAVINPTHTQQYQHTEDRCLRERV